MFVDTMSSAELYDEYIADIPELQFKTRRFDASDQVTKLIRKRQKQSARTITHQFATERGNRYLGIMFYFKEGSDRNPNWAWTSVHVGLMNTHKGLCAILFLENRALKITPHFFKRYKERLYDLVDWQTRNLLSSAKNVVDILSIYIRRNPQITYLETDAVYDSKTHIFGPVPDGVALLQWDEKNEVLQANTFITEDMLNDKQRTMVEYARAYSNLPEEERRKYQRPDCMIDSDEKLD